MLLLENREKMWIFTLLCILWLNILQANGQGNSTQMYYVKLTIDENAIGNLTDLLRPFTNNNSLKVDRLEKTTTCQTVSSGKKCTCEPLHRWSDKECKSNPECCGKEKCTFPKQSSPMCITKDTVTVSGSITLTRKQDYDCLAAKDSTRYWLCNSKLLEKMKAVYSTLMGFDMLTISEYRGGSVIADFEIIVAQRVDPQRLINKSEQLCRNLSASLVLETEGIVSLSMPPNPACYNSEHVLRCTVQEDLHTSPAWQLRKEGEVFDITNGTESDITSETLETKVTLRDITELWAGKYTCVYRQQLPNVYTISHKASAVLDVSLLPDIDISTSPGFPQCQSLSDLLSVRVLCEIDSSHEHFTVTWTSQNIAAEIQEISLRNGSSVGTDVYAVTTFVSCRSSTVKPQLTCSFKNRCNQTRNATADVNIIYVNEQFCEAEGDWGVAAAGFTAVLKCRNTAGKRRRKCQKGSPVATWEPEVSGCVNRKVNSVLHKAEIADIGLGSLDGNAAHVFSLLDDITNDSQTINTMANLNASVQVLLTLNQKQNLHPSESSADDFLGSSSNMLDTSLNNSWIHPADKSNISLAERYLSSVEGLIQRANITSVPRKTNIEVAVRNCSKGSKCANTVFGVTVHVDTPDPVGVKTAGFKELVRYLPNDADVEYEPNSIVVSTTTDGKRSDSVKVQINFPLLRPRPPNVKIQCVYWDNNTRGWSPHGCTWDGPSHEGRCVCSHLSSFAILMSRHPLEVPGINALTYVGLCTSILSLVICLAIEVTVWKAVVKTNTLYLRHMAHVNISLCLLLGDFCFLASSRPRDISVIWCETVVVLKHFFYLSMFFWMLCLSSALLHQAVFLFHNVSKKTYLKFSLFLGYVCPLLIVAVTFLANKAGAEGTYFSRHTCWLVYTGLMKGSIHAFIIPVGIIVFVNVFSMVVVVTKLLSRPKNAETSRDKEKKAAVIVMRSVVLLTPVFGATWMFGFVIMLIDLTSGDIVYAVYYTFTLLNAFQGLFILLTTCLGDKLTRDALLDRFKIIVPASTTDTTTNLPSNSKK